MYESKSFLEHLARIKGPTKFQEPDKRREKARKILSVIEDFAEQRGMDLSRSRCLDLGCSSGSITRALSDRFGHVVGLDTDQMAVRQAITSFEDRSNVSFSVGSGMSLPFPAQTFDVVVCNHVYEHVPSAERLVSEIGRVMRDEGFCYFSAGNKYKVVEAHYRLPFLSWLPRPLADAYVRFLRRGDRYEEQHYSFWQLRHLLQDFEVLDYTLKLIKDPVRFHMTDLIGPRSPVARIPTRVLRMVEPAVPTFVFILRKARPGR